jgi:hypothetical protein
MTPSSVSCQKTGALLGTRMGTRRRCCHVLFCVVVTCFTFLATHSYCRFNASHRACVCVYVCRPVYLCTYNFTESFLRIQQYVQLVDKLLAFYGTPRFIAVFTAANHRSTYPNPTSVRSVLIYFSYRRLCLPSGFFPSCFMYIWRDRMCSCRGLL